MDYTHLIKNFIQRFRLLFKMEYLSVVLSGFLIFITASWICAWAFHFIIGFEQVLLITVLSIGFISFVAVFFSRLGLLIKPQTLVDYAKMVEQRDDTYKGHLVSAVYFASDKPKDESDNRFENEFKTILYDKVTEDLKAKSIWKLKNFRHMRFYFPILVVLMLIFGLGFTAQSDPINFFTKGMVKNPEHVAALSEEEILYLQVIDYPQYLRIGQEFSCEIASNAVHKRIVYYRPDSSFIQNNKERILYSSPDRILDEFNTVISDIDEEIHQDVSNPIQINESFAFAIEYSNDYEEGITQKYLVRVIPELSINMIEVKYTYPESYGIPPKTEYGSGNISARSGTSIDLTIKANIKLADAWLSFTGNDEDTVPMTINQDNHIASIHFSIGGSGNNPSMRFDADSGAARITLPENEYVINLRDVFDADTQVRKKVEVLANDPAVPIEYEPIDNPPEIMILFPQPEIDSHDWTAQLIRFDASDDNHITRIWAEMYNERLFEHEGWISQNISFQENVTQGEFLGEYVNQEFMLDLGPAFIIEGDTIRYKLLIRDNANQIAETELYTLHFLDLFSVFQQTREQEEDMVSDLQQMMRDIQSNSREMQELATELQNSEVQQTDVAQMQQIIRNQQQLISEMEEMIENLSDMQEMLLQQDSARAHELAQRQAEIEELIQELLDEQAYQDLQELRDMLAQMTESSSMNFDPSSFNMEDYLSRLEKTIEQLQRLRDYQLSLEAEHIMEEIIDLQEEMNEQTECEDGADALSDEDSNSESTSELDSQQEELWERIQDVLGNIESQLANRQAEEIARQMGENSQEGEAGQLREEFQESMNSGTCQQSGEIGQQLLEELDELSDMLVQMSGRLGNANAMEILSFLSECIGTLTQIAQSEQSKLATISQARNNQYALNEYQYSDIIEETVFDKSVIQRRSAEFDSIFEGVIPNKTSYIALFNNIITYLDYVVNGLANADRYGRRQISSAINSQDIALRFTGQLIVELIRLESAVSSSSSSSGGSQSGNVDMSDLARSQEQLNESIESLLGRVREGNLSPGEQQYLQQLAQQQRGIGDQVGEVQEEQSEDDTQGLGDLEALQELIEEAAASLEEEQLNETVMERQQEILDRFLEYSRALHSQGETESEERQAETARQQEDTLSDEDLENILIRLLQAQSPPDFSGSGALTIYQRRLIQDYFLNLREISTEGND